MKIIGDTTILTQTCRGATVKSYGVGDDDMEEKEIWCDAIVDLDGFLCAIEGYMWNKDNEEFDLEGTLIELPRMNVMLINTPYKELLPYLINLKTKGKLKD